jgi:hypothetical protein
MEANIIHASYGRVRHAWKKYVYDQKLTLSFSRKDQVLLHRQDLCQRSLSFFSIVGTKKLISLFDCSHRENLGCGVCLRAYAS